MSNRMAIVMLMAVLVALPAYATTELDLDQLEEDVSALSEDDKKKAIERLREIADGLEVALASGSDEPVPWYKRIKIRQSAYDKNKFSKPGSIQYTNADDGDTAYSIDMGISLVAMETDKWLIGPKVEYHRNTNIEKEMNTLMIGITGSYRLGSPTSDPNLGDVRATPMVWADGNLEYKRDGVTDAKSWQIKHVFNPLYAPWAIGTRRGSDNIQWGIDTGAGFEYEDIFSGSNDKDGETLRGTARLGVVVYPLFKAFHTRVEAGISLQYWHEFTQSGDFDDGNDDFDKIITYLNYFLDEDHTVGLSLSQVNGENPSTGLLDQSFTQIGFVIQIGK